MKGSFIKNLFVSIKINYVLKACSSSLKGFSVCMKSKCVKKIRNFDYGQISVNNPGSRSTRRSPATYVPAWLDSAAK